MTQLDPMNDTPDENIIPSDVKLPKLTTKEEVNTLIDDIESYPLNIGEKWYVFSLEWWKKLTTALASGYLEDVTPIDNAAISVQKNNAWFLKPKLVERIDYMLVPSQVFKGLFATFGVEDEDRDVIERTVVENIIRKAATVEVYPRFVTVTLARDRKKVETLTVSQEDTARTIAKRAAIALGCDNVPDNQIRFYIHHKDEDRYELLTGEDEKQNYEHFFAAEQTVVIDVLDEHGEGFIQTKPNRNALVGNGQDRRMRCVPGVCGLQNLGNTCFMASAIQCLSNVPPLTQYFLDDNYKEEINRENPLGTHGELAKVYASLIHEMWNGYNSAVVPRHLKMTIGQFAPRFSGYSQQDSQELLAFLLDGLHEDLNRIKKKPYIPEDESSDTKPDEELAAQQWEQYKARNDSIVVDKVHGQIKSTLVCPICQKISIKFDPFCFLSLPLPPKERLYRQSFVLIYNPVKKWAKFSMCITRLTTVLTATQVMKTIMRREDPLRVVMWYTDGDRVSVISEHESISQLVGNTYMPSNNTVYATEVSETAEDFIIVKSHNNNGKPIAIPMVFGMEPGENVTREWLESKVVPFVREQYTKEKEKKEGDGEDMDDGENRVYELLMERSGSLVPYEDGMNPSTVVIKWKHPSIFTGYNGKELVDRECTVNQRTEIGLTDCIDLFTKEEQLGEQDSWYCPRCKKHQRASKKLDLWKLPEILIVHLKRFQYTKWNREKIDLQVQIPVNGFELNDKLANQKHEHVKYDLIAISHHMGGLGGGHYTASALNPNGKWYDFNDAGTNERNPPQDPFKGSTPYMLIYQKKSVSVVDSNIEMETDE